MQRKHSAYMRFALNWGSGIQRRLGACDVCFLVPQMNTLSYYNSLQGADKEAGEALANGHQKRWLGFELLPAQYFVEREAGEFHSRSLLSGRKGDSLTGYWKHLPIERQTRNCLLEHQQQSFVGDSKGHWVFCLCSDMPIGLYWFGSDPSQSQRALSVADVLWSSLCLRGRIQA